jgi:hypothetical protein
MESKQDLAEFEEKLQLYKEKMQELADMQEEIFQQAMQTYKTTSMEAARKKINEVI